MAENSRTDVWISDDGELADVGTLLDRLEVPWARLLRDPQTGEDSEQVADVLRSGSLLFTSPAHAVRLQPAVMRSDVLHVVVIDQVPRTLRRMLERSRCDFVLQRPIEPTLLRLLISHALYAGPEKRRASRVVIGEPVSFKAGPRSKSAMLIELSEGGCSLETPQVVDVGAAIQLTLPRELTGGKALRLDCKVTARGPGPGDPAAYRLSLAFVSGARGRRELRSVIRTHARGSATLAAEAGAGGSLKLRSDRQQQPEAESREERHPPQVERRQWPRRRYRKQFLATSGGATRTLIGSDLSRGGMRVGYDPDLSVGDEFKLAIYGNAGQPPVVVRAVIVRGDDESWGLEFRDMGDRATSRLEQLIQGLPELPGGSRPKPGQVMTEVLE